MRRYASGPRRCAPYSDGLFRERAHDALSITETPSIPMPGDPSLPPPGRFRSAATLALAPLLLAQGRRTRARTPRLPEPSGARQGTRGAGPPLSLLIVGDSSAAGVGAATQDEALLGRTLALLAPHRRVRFRLVARTGWTTAEALAAVEALPAEPFDVAVTALGVNDVTARVPLGPWLARQRALRAMLTARFGVARTIVSGVPPMGEFPVLPQPLRAWLGALADQRDVALRAAVAGAPDVRFVPLRAFSADAAMSTDGFHPGPTVYAEWAERVAAQVLEPSPVRAAARPATA